MPKTAHVVNAMLHPWEEPPISEGVGAGAIFFAGCNLKCVFCQNYEISQPKPRRGTPLSVPQLVELFWRLERQGACCIDLVSPTLYLMTLRDALREAKKQHFPLPFVWNTNAYENPAGLELLEGLVDVYLPDFKYVDNYLAEKYSDAPNYYGIATAAILEMQRQVGRFTGSGVTAHGLLIRHLVLPGCRNDSMKVLDWIHRNIPGSTISIMRQYVPMYRAGEFPEINRRITSCESDSVCKHWLDLGERCGYVQEQGCADCGYTPDFTRAFKDYCPVHWKDGDDSLDIQIPKDPPGISYTVPGAPRMDTTPYTTAAQTPAAPAAEPAVPYTWGTEGNPYGWSTPSPAAPLPAEAGYDGTYGVAF
ncbi:MAG: radical SAM protein [Oscillospiraceae bacterium]|jgi:putative pyruvate formate lyase activating enzyme|nr:radical SAM protein [Oscillospiraceae bacterium]